MQRKNKIEWIPLSEAHSIQFEGSQEYFLAFPDIEASKYRNHPFCFDIDFKAQSNRFPFRCDLVCDVWNQQHNSVESCYTSLQPLHSDISSPAYFHQRIYLENIPESAETIKIFFYNQLKTPIKFTDLNVTILKGIEKSNPQNL